MADRPLRVALWCAVSSRPQAADDKTSLDDQRQAGEQFAAAIGGSVVVTYTVPGHSRDYVLWQDAEQAIPAYRDLRADCDRHAFDVLHATDADRLGRTAALIHQVIGLVEASGAEVYLASSPHTVGQSTVAQRYLSAIQAVRAEEEQSIRIARHERGMRGRVRRGLHPGTWPFGYAAVRDVRGETIGAELVPEEAATVRHITERFLAGISYRDIARELNDAGFPVGSRASCWHATKVRDVMFNNTYGGYPAWGNAAPEQRSPHYMPLWDDAAYVAVVAERHARGTRQYHTTALLDVAFCLRCDGRMTRGAFTNQQGRRYIYLRCGPHANGDRVCHPNHILERDIQDAVVGFLAGALARADQVEALIDSRVLPRHGLQAQLADLDARQEEIAAQRARLALALAAGGMDVQMYRQTDDSLLGELDGVNAAYQSIELRLAALPSPQQQRATMNLLAQSLPGLWQMPPREAAALLQAVGLYVWCENRKISRIEFRQM